MIEVNGLVKRFDGFAALDGAALSVPAGSVYGLVGPNGAGKSTLIRHLTGIFRQDAGTVRIGGEDVWENAALKARIAAIPDDWYYFLQSSIRDMMRFYRGFYPAFSMERYEKLKEVFQLDEKRPIRRLSKGMQKQAAFWLALCCMPDYLILDEPVDGLDPVMRRQVWSLVLADVAQRGTTVLVSSHNLRELEDVCDHVGIMDHGRVLLERSLAQLQDNMVKLQVVFPDGMTEVPSDLPVLHILPGASDVVDQIHGGGEPFHHPGVISGKAEDEPLGEGGDQPVQQHRQEVEQGVQRRHGEGVAGDEGHEGGAGEVEEALTQHCQDGDGQPLGVKGPAAQGDHDAQDSGDRVGNQGHGEAGEEVGEEQPFPPDRQGVHQPHAAGVV